VALSRWIVLTTGSILDNARARRRGENCPFASAPGVLIRKEKGRAFRARPLVHFRSWCYFTNGPIKLPALTPSASAWKFTTTR
jgi:hypothetical protein